MFLFQAAEGIGKAGGHYSGRSLARPYDFIFICQEKHLPHISQPVRGLQGPTSHGLGGRLKTHRPRGLVITAAISLIKYCLAGRTPRVCQALRTGEQTGTKD